MWPLVLALAIFFLVVNLVSYFLLGFNMPIYTVLISVASPVVTLLVWYKDFCNERIVGFHTHKLELALRVGMLLFILREVLFFFRFFWAFFDRAMAPTVEYGLMWPPKGIVSISFYSVPLLNTIILLTSGVTITIAHHEIVENNYGDRVLRLRVTIALGAFFLFTQLEEYQEARFTIADGVYGSIFYIATGFHGMHVFIGTCMLTYVLYNMVIGKLLPTHHFRFEAAAWYWHFVDVVWLFLYVVVYVWFA